MFEKKVREVRDDGTEHREIFKAPESDEKKIVNTNYLAGLIRKTASEKMEKPGDFYYATPHGESGWNYPYIMLNCPYCGIAFALPKHKILNQRGEPLTIEKEIRCAYNQAHYFKIHEGNVIPLGNLK
jgi:hypothetical protein